MLNATRLYVGSLPWSLTEKDLMELFSRWGTVTDLVVPANKESVQHANAGFCFVCYSEPQAARTALDELNGMSLNGRILKCDYARPRKPLGYQDRRSMAGGD